MVEVFYSQSAVYGRDHCTMSAMQSAPRAE
jgi:hypothetical protein